MHTNRILIICIFVISVNCDLRSDFNERVDKLINASLDYVGCGKYENLVKLEYTDEFCGDGFVGDTNGFYARTDGSDFNLAAFSWLFNKYWDHPALTQEFKDIIVDAILQLPFWLSESGNIGEMQSWSENHQIGWKSGKHLIGQGFANHPDLEHLIFIPSQTNGSMAAEIGGKTSRQWLEYRSRFGFSEFNSDTYAPIAYKAIAALVGLSENPEIQILAEMVMNLQLFDHIIGSKGRRLSTSRGRAYSEGRIGYKKYELFYLLKGIGDIPVGHSESTMLALAVKYGYEIPEALLEIAQEVEHDTFEMKERFGLDPKDGKSEGILTDNPEDCIFWFSDGAYFDPHSPHCIFLVGDAYNLWNRTEGGVWGSTLIAAKPIWDESPNFVIKLGQQLPMFGGGSTLGPANVYTYRTPDYMLSSTQNYKIGWTVGQQHDWQATLDENREGTFFSHQPVTTTVDTDHYSDYWVIGIHPKIAQYKNTLISIHNPDLIATLVFSLKITHACFHQNQVDEFYSDGHWFIASQGSAYVGMYTHHEASFNPDSDFDLVANGIQNVWICQMGSEATDGSFDQFKDNLLQSKIEVSFSYNDSFAQCLIDNHCLNDIQSLLNCIANICLTKRFNTPIANCLENSQSEINQLSCLSEMRSEILTTFTPIDGRKFTFSWTQPMAIDGEIVQDGENYPRYENTFASVPWGSKVFNISSMAGHYVYMDFENLRQSVGSIIG